MDSRYAEILSQLDDRSAVLQSDIFSINVETGRPDLHKFGVDRSNYFSSYPEEVELMKQAEEAVLVGTTVINTLYTYRTVSKSIPEISLADYATEDLTMEEKVNLAAKTAEINQKFLIEHPAR